MHGGKAHSHDHGHHHGPSASTPLGGRYSIAIALNAAFVVLEGLAGFWTNSTALLADAGHNLSDVLGLALAGAAAWLAGRAASARRTFGFGKAPVLAALGNALLLVGASGAIAWEALRRLGEPPAILPLPVAAVAAVGVVINASSALLFLKARAEDVNARGAFVHMAADAGVSAGVIVSGLLIWRTGAFWIDPAVTLAIVVVIALGAFDLLRDSLDLALDAAPPGVDIAAVRDHLAGLPGVAAVHDLHVWAMSHKQISLTAHLVRPAGGDDPFLLAAGASLRERFGIAHATLQIESQAQDLCDDHGHP